MPDTLKQAVLDGLHGVALTAAEQTALSQEPDLQAAVVTESEVTTDSGLGNPNPPAGGGAAPQTAPVYCRWYEGTYTLKSSVFHTVLYRWGKHTDVCYNGRTITRLNSNYYYIRDRSTSTIVDGGLLVNQTDAAGWYDLRTYSRGRMKNCVFHYGCFSETYPWVEIIAHKNGTADIHVGRS